MLVSYRTEEGAFNLEFAFDMASFAVSNLHAVLANLSSRYRAAGLDPFKSLHSVDRISDIGRRAFQLEVDVGAGVAVMSALVAMRAVAECLGGRCGNPSHLDCKVAQEARDVCAHPERGTLFIQAVGSEAITLRFLSDESPGDQTVERVLDAYAECLSARMAAARTKMPEFTNHLREARVRFLQARNQRLPPRLRDFADGRRSANSPSNA